MSNPIALFDDLRDMYLRYLDSPFDLRYPELVAERRALLTVDGRLFRQPLIEPIPAYRSSNQTFQAIAQGRLGGSWSNAEIADLADFVSLELFPPARLPYAHQDQVFAESVVNRNDVIVTTGTGSGKTECFLLPIIAALIRESAAWGNQASVTRVGIGGTIARTRLQTGGCRGSRNGVTRPRQCVLQPCAPSSSIP